MAAAAAGVIVALGDDLRFVPAGTAERIVARPVVTRVPGTDIGMALIGGRVVTVLELNKRRAELLLCTVGDEHVALSGLAVMASGLFEKSGDHVLLDGKPVPELDVARELRRAERALFSRRTSSSPPAGPEE